MIFRIFSLLFGYTRFYTEDVEGVLNLLLHSGISYFGQRKEERGISFCTLFFSEKSVKRALLCGGIEDFRTERCGSIRIFEKYALRFGIPVGIIIFSFIVFLSERYIWKIDIKGNESVSDGEILRLLENYGVYEGAPSKGIDTYGISNLCLIDEKSLSYMSINVIGSCAEIVVMEKSEKNEEESDDIPSSIIAARSGRITEMEVFSGDALVSVGDTVFAGQTLVSGLYSFSEGRYMLVRSKARIVAQTVREFSVSVPLSETEIRVTQEKTLEKSIFFFAKEIKILKNSRKTDPTCDTIERRNRVMLFGRIALPIYINTVSEISYEDCEITRDYTEALLVAKEKMGELLSQYDLLSYEIKELEEDGRVTLFARAVVCEEISSEMKMIDYKK